jgi:hypothetical protein
MPQLQRKQNSMLKMQKPLLKKLRKKQRDKLFEIHKHKL